MDRDTGPKARPGGPAVPGPEPAVPDPLADKRRSVIGGLSADPRVPIWIRRAIFALVVGTAIGIWQGWRWGLTAAAVVAILDTIYQSKAMSPVPAEVYSASAQRRTRHRLLMLRSSGYLALHGRAIPGSDSVIDHLVIGPSGVFAVDSERWDRRLPVRATAAGKSSSGMLYHGPFSQSPRLAHARWEAAQAARLLGEELGGEIDVSPAMVIYGPTIPWGVATLRGVDVFGGRRIGKFFRRQKRITRGQRLDEHEISLIYEAAERALPPAR